MGVTAAARLAGVSVRTLQFYDRIGLLPAGRDEAGRRSYDQQHLLRLQRILLMVGAGATLAQIADTLDRQPAEPLVAVLDEQIRQLEIRELSVRGQRTVLAGLAAVLRRHPAATVPVAAVCALTNLDGTLLRFPDIDLAPSLAEFSEHQVQMMLTTYFAWKACAVQALVLIENGIHADSPTGAMLGADRVHAREALADDAPDLLELHLRTEAEVDRWPAPDRDLHLATKEFLNACEHAYIARQAGGADSSPSSARSSAEP